MTVGGVERSRKRCPQTRYNHELAATQLADWLAVYAHNLAAPPGTRMPPDLRLDPVVLEEGFTAFRLPLASGEPSYRAYPGYVVRRLVAYVVGIGYLSAGGLPAKLVSAGAVVGGVTGRPAYPGDDHDRSYDRLVTGARR